MTQTKEEVGSILFVFFFWPIEKRKREFAETVQHITIQTWICAIMSTPVLTSWQWPWEAGRQPAWHDIKSTGEISNRARLFFYFYWKIMMLMTTAPLWSLIMRKSQDSLARSHARTQSQVSSNNNMLASWCCWTYRTYRWSSACLRAVTGHTSRQQQFDSIQLLIMN